MVIEILYASVTKAAMGASWRPKRLAGPAILEENRLSPDDYFFSKQILRIPVMID